MSEEVNEVVYRRAWDSHLCENSTTLLVLLAIAWQTDKDGTVCLPTWRLSEMAGMSPRAVANNIKRLIECGDLYQYRRPGNHAPLYGVLSGLSEESRQETIDKVLIRGGYHNQDIDYSDTGSYFERYGAQIALRDGMTCHYCGTWLMPLSALWDLIAPNGTGNRNEIDFMNDHMATVDHVISRYRGGSDNLDNLVLSCRRCNSSKGAT